MPAPLTLAARECRAETARTGIIRLALDARAFPFLAGQAAWLGLHGHPLREPYSIACAPEQAARDRQLEFLIQIADEAGVRSHLADVRPGDLIDVDGPAGGFVLEDDQGAEPLLFVAGGTGIAPLRAMIWHALLSRASADVTLLYSARRPDEFPFGAEFLDLARTGRIRLRQTITRAAGDAWTGHRGRIARAHLADLVAGRTPLCFLCGPAGFTDNVRAVLQTLEVPASRTRTESWG